MNVAELPMWSEISGKDHAHICIKETFKDIHGLILTFEEEAKPRSKSARYFNE